MSSSQGGFGDDGPPPPPPPREEPQQQLPSVPTRRSTRSSAAAAAAPAGGNEGGTTVAGGGGVARDPAAPAAMAPPAAAAPAAARRPIVGGAGAEDDGDGVDFFAEVEAMDASSDDDEEDFADMHDNDHDDDDEDSSDDEHGDMMEMALMAAAAQTDRIRRRATEDALGRRGGGVERAAAAAAGGGPAASGAVTAAASAPPTRTRPTGTRTSAGAGGTSSSGGGSTAAAPSPPAAASSRGSATRGAGIDGTATATGPSAAGSGAGTGGTATTGTGADAPPRRSLRSGRDASSITGGGTGTVTSLPNPHATSRALAARRNAALADAANLGPPTGLRNDEGAPTYYPPLPGSTGRAVEIRGGFAADLRMALAGDRGGGGGGGIGAAPVPIGFAGYPGALGGGARYRLGAGNERRGAAAGGGGGRSTLAGDDVDQAALLTACVRRFGSNFFPDPLMPYCGRRMGRHAVPNHSGTCSPYASSSRGVCTVCSSCARLHDSLRLARLRYMFGGAPDIFVPSDVDFKSSAATSGTSSTDVAEPSRYVVGDSALIAALRCNSGLIPPTVSLLTRELGLQPRPHPRQVAHVARLLGLPEKLARVALRRKACDSTLAIGWVCGFSGSGRPSSADAGKSPLDLCYEEAMAEDKCLSGAPGSSPAQNVAEEPLALLSSLCTEVKVSSESPAVAACSRTRSTSERKARLKSTGDDDGMDIGEDVECCLADEPTILDGHVLIPAKHYLSTGLETNKPEKPLTSSQRNDLQAALDANVHVNDVNSTLMKGLGDIIAESKETNSGTEIGDSLAFDVNKLSAVTQHKLYRYVMENVGAKCPMCTLPIPSVHAGQRRCVQCQMCEGCIRFCRHKRFTKYAVEEPTRRTRDEEPTRRTRVEVPTRRRRVEVPTRRTRVEGRTRRTRVEEPRQGPARTRRVARESIGAGVQQQETLGAVEEGGAPAFPSAAAAAASAVVPKQDHDDYNSEEDGDYDPKRDDTAEDGDMDIDDADDFFDEADALSEEEAADKCLVHVCPAQPNGSHLHHHPLYLQFTRNKTAHCDIEGPCCTALCRNKRWYVSWSCAVCDFDICHVCIGMKAPEKPPTRSIPNSRSVPLPNGGTKVVDGMFDRRLGLVVSSTDSSRKRRSSSGAKKGTAASAAAASKKATNGVAKQNTGAAKAAQGGSPPKSGSAVSASATISAHSSTTSVTRPSRRSASAPSSTSIAPHRGPTTSRSSSAPTSTATAAASHHSADDEEEDDNIADIAAFDPAAEFADVFGGLLGEDAGYFDAFNGMGAGATAAYGARARRAARLRELRNFRIALPGVGGRGGVAVATINGAGPLGDGTGMDRLAIVNLRGNAGAGAGADADARNRALEKSLKKKDEKLVSQIWNVEPLPAGKDSGVVVVNTGNVTPNTAADLGSGLLSPHSMTDYGRIWLYAFRSGVDGTPTLDAGQGGSMGDAGNASRNASMAVMGEEAKTALSTFVTRSSKISGSGSALGVGSTSPSALDITTAELYCQRIQSLIPNRAAAIRTKAYGMVAMGKLGLVGTILSASSFAPLALSRTTDATDTIDSSSPAAAASTTSKPKPPTPRAKKRKRDDPPEKSESQKKNSKSSASHKLAQVTTSVCFCGSPIDVRTAPDGCVGCLRCGHAVHAPCAADLLLGGGVCPACREPLYLPRLGSDEVHAAENIFHKELLGMETPVGSSGSAEKGGEKSSSVASKGEDGTPVTIGEGDIVRISNDGELCSTIQSTCPTSGGWYADMAECCGIEGQVVAIVSLGSSETKSEAYRVRMKVPHPSSSSDGKTKTKHRDHSFRHTRRSRSSQGGGQRNRDGHTSIFTACIECNRSSNEMRMCVNCEVCISCLSRSPHKAACCTMTVHQWIWSPALVTFVRKGILPRVYKESKSLVGQSKKDDVAAATEDAQKHMMRLRAELHAVKASRDVVREEAESIFGTPASDSDEDNAIETKAQMIVGIVRDRTVLKLPESIRALSTAVAAKGSAFQFHLARHLLSLSEQWASNPAFGPKVSPPASVMTNVRAVQKLVSDRNLEAAARHIRNYNADDEVSEAEWDCAYDTTGTYVAKAGAQISLLAYPKDGAPPTGFVLQPKTRFQASFEHLDNKGNAWAQVVEPEDWPDSYIAALDETSQEGYGAVLVGSRVKRGPNWQYGNQDGGEGNEGVIVKARRGQVLVRWNGIESKFRYRYQPKKAGHGESRSSSRKEVKICSAIAPPQGWFQIDASPRAVERICTSLKCWACSKALCASSASKAVYHRVNTSTLEKGDKVLVASTLEPVTVEEVTDHRVHCSFAVPKDFLPEDDDNEKPATKRTRRNKDDKKEAPKTAPIAAAAAPACIWYRPVDLVIPSDESKAAIPSEVPTEIRVISGKLRTMHEVALLHPGDKEGAKAAWAQAGDANNDPHGDISSFASCLRGHLFHPKCFQTALLSGNRCPAPGCGELLWLPSIVRDEEHVTCGDGGTTSASSDTESMRAETDLSNHDEEAKPSESVNDANSLFTEEELAAEGCRMCPACCSGPFLNHHCSDMRTHHGQCSAMAWRGAGDDRRRTPCLPDGRTFQVSATEISKRLMQLSKGKTVADVLPRCPTHKVSVMFNGCRGCGHLFTDVGWHNLPKWDPNAKEKVALDKKKMQASVLLCSQIRKETAQLEFEREALQGLKTLNDNSSS